MLLNITKNGQRSTPFKYLNTFLTVQCVVGNHSYSYYRPVNSISADPTNVHNGDMKWILALMWRLIRHFHISAHSIDSRLEQFILAWVQAQIPDQNIKNFTKDWNDGVALCALVEHIEPGACPDYATRNREKKRENCSHGIELADKSLELQKLSSLRICVTQMLTPKVS